MHLKKISSCFFVFFSFEIQHINVEMGIYILNKVIYELVLIL